MDSEKCWSRWIEGPGKAKELLESGTRGSELQLQGMVAWKRKAWSWVTVMSSASSAELFAMTETVFVCVVQYDSQRGMDSYMGSATKGIIFFTLFNEIQINITTCG